jgi:hypothetical protein
VCRGSRTKPGREVGGGKRDEKRVREEERREKRGGK